HRDTRHLHLPLADKPRRRGSTEEHGDFPGISVPLWLRVYLRRAALSPNSRSIRNSRSSVGLTLYDGGRTQSVTERIGSFMRKMVCTCPGDCDSAVLSCSTRSSVNRSAGSSTIMVRVF